MKRSSPTRRTATISAALLLLYSSGILCFTVPHSSSSRRCDTQQLSIPRGCHNNSCTKLFVGTNLDNNNNYEDDKPSLGEMQTMITDVGVKIVAVALFGFILINTLSFATSVTTTVFSALFDEIGREATQLFSILSSIFFSIMSGIFGFVQVAAPAIGKGAVAAGKAAAPVLESTAKSIGEAAGPIVQDVTEQISQTAAPYVQPVMESVDSSVKGAVDSISNSVDANLMSPLRDAATSVTDSVNTAVDSSIREATRAVDDSIVAPINAAKESVTSAVDSTIKGATDSAIGAMDGAMKGAVDAVSNSFYSSGLSGTDTTLE